ncbi:MAG: SLC13 family permease [Acidimicrobiales bacterium]
MTVARLALLLVAVAGATLRPRRIPAFAAPVACVAIAVVSGLVSWHETGHAVSPLLDPLAFLLTAIPLAVLLDRLGYFEQLADSFGNGRWLIPGLWLLGTGTVAVLNLDAAVVLLTPLYFRIATRHGLPRRFVCFQPVVLALLASSFLPVSNLTNLIATARFGIGPLEWFEHLGAPAVVACAVGYSCYRPATRTAGDLPAAEEPETPPDRKTARDGRVLLGGSVVVALVLAGFLAGPAIGVRAWEVALGADVILVAASRSVPFRSVPWETALVAAGLGVLATAAVEGVDLSALLGGSGPLAMMRAAAASAGGANVVNNLPALLVALPSAAGAGGRASCQLWPILLGVNAGPGLLITGSLSTLLWVDSMRRLGAPVRAGVFFRMGLRVVMPAAVAALAVLLVLAPLVGCG